MDGEYREIPGVRISIDTKRIKVATARIVWPRAVDLQIHANGVEAKWSCKIRRATQLYS